MTVKNFKRIQYHLNMSAKLDKMIDRAKSLVKLRIIPNTSESKTLVNIPSENKQKKVTFRVSAFMTKNLEEIISQSDLSISIFVKTALYNYISFYKELSCEPFELEHWLDDAEINLTYSRYTITLDDTLSNEFNRLESVYRANGLRFNKSHFIRCAVVERLNGLMFEE